MKLARLTRRSARDAWAHEDHDFTPWLADNLDLLAEVLGLRLELVEREHQVGRYSLDLLLEDGRGRVVIAENQFGSTNHDHLGKLLTYCAGTDAKVLIWIAEAFTSEHVAALEWLNENSTGDVGFFGVEVSVLQIGDSDLAPDFRVLARPNDWTKAARGILRDPVDWDWNSYAEILGQSEEKLAVTRALVNRVEAEIKARGLHWKPRFNKGYIAFRRPDGLNVGLVAFSWSRTPRLAVILPEPPTELGLDNPYPDLHTNWDRAKNETWWTADGDVESLDLGPYFDLAMRFHDT